MSSWKNHKITLSLEKSSVASAFGSDCKRLWASSSLLGVICGVGFLERRGVGDGVFSVFGPDGWSFQLGWAVQSGGLLVRPSGGSRRLLNRFRCEFRFFPCLDSHALFAIADFSLGTEWILSEQLGIKVQPQRCSRNKISMGRRNTIFESFASEKYYIFLKYFSQN